MELTASQQAVVDCTDREILVTAGAGSGKTSTTIERYKALLERGPEPLTPREILVFTFTDKAAGELREKVRAALVTKARAGSDGDPNAVSMSNAWVGTFHAICNRILKAWPMEAGIDPGFSVLDSTSTETLMKVAFDRALKRFCDAGENRAELPGRFVGQALRETITWSYDELRSRGIERPRLPDFVDTAFPKEEVDRLRSLAEAGLKGDPTNNRRTSLEGICDLLDSGAWTSLNFGKTLGLRARENQALIEIEDANKDLCDAMARHLADPVRRGLGELLDNYGEEFNAAKQSRSALDYDDLQLVTLRLLRDHHHIRDAYRERFREIMVDEFQDTNGLQIQLIEELKGSETTLLTVGDEMQSIYGFRHADVALFRKRRDTEGVTRIELQENFRSQGRVIGAINEIGTALDDEASTRRSEDAGRHRFEPLQVGLTENDPSGSSTTLILTDHLGWREMELGEMAPAIPAESEVGKPADHRNEAEALALAHHLRDLVDDSTNEVCQGDIAILLRAKTRTDLYVKALEQAGLSPYVVSGGGFWKTREAVEVRALLSVIANPLDDNQLLGALTSPACGLSTDTLWLLRKASAPYQPLWPALATLADKDGAGVEDAQWLAHVPHMDRERATRFVSTIDSLRNRSSAMPLASLIEAAVTETGYDLANLLRDPSANGLATIRRAESLAREFEAGEGRNLRGFLDWSRLSEELDSEAAAATADEASDVVRLMTIHAAKGLQFKVTCVPDLGRSCAGRHRQALRLSRSKEGRPEEFEVGLRLPRFDGGKIDAYGWKELAEADKAATEDEELRLLHVAVTRAENHLVLSGVMPEKWPKDGTSHASPMALRTSVQFGFDPEEPGSWDAWIPVGDDDEDGILVVHNAAVPECAARLAAVRQPLRKEQTAQSGTPPLAKPDSRTYPDVPLSFTAFSEFIECPARFYAKRVLKVEMPDEWNQFGDPAIQPASGRNRSTRFGSAVHGILEEIALEGWKQPSADELQAALGRHGLARGRDTAGDLQRATKMVSGFLESDLGKRVAAGSTAVEVPLVVRYEEVTIRGSADLILASEIPLILDYKTNHLDGLEPEEKMTDYDLQRGLYALALARARGLDEVETAYSFLEAPERPVMKMYRAADFDTTEDLLRQTLAEIIGGRFFGGPGAKHQPCGKSECAGCRLLSAQIERASAGVG
ncbi:MAG: UvrD-helicase domain-containing protein [Solirubrobacterales bacterium]